MLSTAGALGVASLVFVLARWLLRRERGDRILLADAGPVAIPLSALWPPKGRLGDYWSHFIPFDRAGTTVVPCIFPLTAQRCIHVADAEAMKTILNDRHGFVKNTKEYELLGFFGANILCTEGDEWVRHRSIARKSFGEKNNALVWSETVRVLDEWFMPWDHAGSSTTTNITDDLRHITLFVIASAGFSLKLVRSKMARPSAGFRMPFGEALFTAVHTVFLRIATPRFLYSLPIPSLQRCDTAYTELERYIRQMIVEAREGETGVSDASEAADLFRRLVDANQAETGARLSDEELAANIYVYFVAGHETSSHTLTFALALLAIHPEVQEKLYDEVQRVWPDLNSEQWSSSTLNDSTKLEYALAVFRETLRLFPAAIRISRWATGDMTIPCQNRNAAGCWEPGRVAVRAGTSCILNLHSVHMSPLYWGDDAAAFRPERFLSEWPRDAWVPFTCGPHVCLGQRFATLESICVLARIVRKYRLAPTPEIAVLPREQQWARLTKWTVGITVTPGPVQLVLERRYK
ncbi:cytochrome P450 [Auricularia subglabra TFB-10046 SS5]|uniref:Cytochrome P450 n=1 Tax=Auricularia subglabra (strain TFB-10046 / SS5) TaxID=717982 RepID=J0WRU3_AURST|nr:cytochrome P450 [Auricularia subglabra TFB-10046 SS5]